MIFQGGMKASDFGIFIIELIS